MSWLSGHNREDFVTYVMAAPGLVAKDGREETQKPDVGIYIREYQRYSIKICYDCDGDIMGIFHGDIMAIFCEKTSKKSQLDTTENDFPRRASIAGSSSCHV